MKPFQRGALDVLQSATKGLTTIKQLQGTMEDDIITTTPVFISTAQLAITPSTKTTGCMRLHTSDITQAFAAKDPKMLFKSDSHFSLGECNFEMRFYPTSYQKDSAALHIHLVPPSGETHLTPRATASPKGEVLIPALSITVVVYDCQVKDGDLNASPADARIVTYEESVLEARCLKDWSIPVASFPHILKHEEVKSILGNVVAIDAAMELTGFTE